MFAVSVPVKDAYLNAAAAAGVQWLEIQAAELPAHDEATQRKYLEDARRAITRRGLEVVSLHICYIEPGLGSLDESRNQFVMDHAIRSMRLGSEIFPKALYVLHPGESIEVPDKAELQRQRSRAMIARIAELAEKLGVKVAVENMRKGDPSEKFIPRVGQEMEWIREAVEGFDSLGICLDTGHAHISGDICKMARIAGDKLIHVHLSDNFGVYDNHLFPGEAEIPWKEFGSIVAGEVKFAGALTLEIKLPEDEETLTAIFKRGRIFVREIF